MPHKNYFEIKAKNYYDLGFQKGRLFGGFLRQSIKALKKEGSWNSKLLIRSKAPVAITRKSFPHLIEELEGYAEGADVPFDELWLLSIEDELFESKFGKCTSIITNSGLLIAHNEDWDADAKDSICVLKKTMRGQTILELFYLNTLGGNSVSVNSNGFVQAIDTLTHADKQIGVPRNVIARWLSETKSPESDYERLAALERSSGYSHSLVSVNGKIWNIECSAREEILTRPNSPFVHTNHFLTELRKLENEDNS
ncbi:MAG: hypothetical protein KAV87_62030, partial [Desulfobacteraceae bacterium]|nr:hypothetical protein [Desulfobacteraceae bacterium]